MITSLTRHCMQNNASIVSRATTLAATTAHHATSSSPASIPGRRYLSDDSLTMSLKTAWSTPIKEGATIPKVIFKTRVRVASDVENPFDWKDVTSEDYFKGKRSVLFALPGAFTPTCSSTHVPGYDAAYDEIKSLGIDEIYCLSVNDTFVMRQWGLKLGLSEDKTIGANGFEKVKLIPDGAALFTRGMGMSTLWTSERGFGERSWRYSAVIDDMKVEKMFIEGGGITQNSGPDPFEVSDADTMLEYLRSCTK
mmetsp:Transcript_64610/g.76502  ORF Transcript_64610/g.76502 Transcript_64610/m.76502 type:complete len:252 (+) Transcript_64610:71-826(+)|eukprot:CAMPEP_0172518556 /NCGR_PEP_ID=MMETSP1066-20121228/290893_1 /TAXON_ID=671091 /ORGANISM="Coscinodiscus wailesii, Strain CCMP2513" /LENGTH=251 /DNA_ID=CAMNT_0013300975 /DNA_START=457 /DNA_END=1212 /DNA_ORIENTATION=-